MSRSSTYLLAELAKSRAWGVRGWTEARRQRARAEHWKHRCLTERQRRRSRA